jgi:hypothetical protein
MRGLRERYKAKYVPFVRRHDTTTSLVLTPSVAGDVVSAMISRPMAANRAGISIASGIGFAWPLKT